MISSRHLQKALEHYYETHEPKWRFVWTAHKVEPPAPRYSTKGVPDGWVAVTCFSDVVYKLTWKSAPLTITDLRFKWYIRLWLKIKSLSWRREQQAGLKHWRPIKI